MPFGGDVNVSHAHCYLVGSYRGTVISGVLLQTESELWPGLTNQLIQLEGQEVAVSPRLGTARLDVVQSLLSDIPAYKQAPLFTGKLSSI